MPPKRKPEPSAQSKSSSSLLNFFSRAADASSPNGDAGDRKGKAKAAAASVGESASHPVVISDEEDDVPRKRRRKEPGLSTTSRNGKLPAHESEVATADEAGPNEATETLVAECMVCSAPLPTDAVAAEAHVNACLDAGVGSARRDVHATPRKAPTKKSPSPEIVVLSPDPDPPPPKERRKTPTATRKERDETPRPITSISHTLRTTPEPPSNGKANAFSVLMSSHKEKETWAEVDEPKAVPGRRRAAPFYKVITGMPISVDAFCYGAIPGVTAYFLTHAHSDHYTSLSKNWRHGPIYCSQTTANLVVIMLGVDPQWVHGIPDDVPYTIPNTGGVTVTLIEANHCPGSSLFLFEGKQTVNAGDSSFRSPYVGSKRVFRYLHCGDFRACPKHVLHPEVARAPLDTVYLDTTYLNPQYLFPPQPLVIEACAELAKKIAIDDVDIKPKIEAAEAGNDENEEAEMPGEIEFQEDEDEDEDIKPDIGDEDYGVGDEDEPCGDEVYDDEDIKPDLDQFETLLDVERAEVLEETEQNPNVDTELDADTKPDVDIKPDVDTKPDVNIKPDVDTKPDVDIKPDVKPHPAALAYGILERSVAMMEGWLGKNPSNDAAVARKGGRVLVLVGTYTIGKERIVKAIARALSAKIYCEPRKRGILRAQADDELHAMLGDDPRKVHLVSLGNISLERLQPYLNALKPHFDRVVAFRPTGWTYRAPAGTNMLPDVNFVIKRDQARGFSDVSLRPIRGSSRQFMMFGVPYSEHSSFFELTCFSLSVPGNAKIIATVNVNNERSRAKMRKWFEKWAAEKARRRERGAPPVVEYRDETYVSYPAHQLS